MTEIQDTNELEPKPQLLSEGDVVELKDGHEVIVSIPAKHVYADPKNPDELRQAFVVIGKDHNGYDTRHLAGRYAVFKTALDGGGRGGQGGYDEWQNEHHAYCRQMLEDGALGREVNFFQTGMFRGTIKDIEPVGKVEFKYAPVANTTPTVALPAK